MSAGSMRDFAAHVAIIAASLYGLHAAVIERAEGRLEAARIKLATLEDRARQGGLLHAARPTIEHHVERAQQRLSDLRTRSRMALDQRELFSALNGAAARSGVQIEQLRALDEHGAAPRPGQKVARLACGLTLRGQYADLAACVKAMGSELGLSNVRTVRLRSAGEGSAVTAEIEAVWLAAPSVASTAGEEGLP